MFKVVSKEHALTWGDFPAPAEYAAKLRRDDFYKFQPLHPKLIGAMEQVLHTDIPMLMRMLPDEAAYAYAAAEDPARSSGGASRQERPTTARLQPAPTPPRGADPA